MASIISSHSRKYYHHRIVVLFAATSSIVISTIWCGGAGGTQAQGPATADSGAASVTDGSDAQQFALRPARDLGDASIDAAHALECSQDDAGIPQECRERTVTPAFAGGRCRIPSGCFVIGSPRCEWGRGAYSENQVPVTLTHAFEIQATEFTQAAWTALGWDNPSEAKPSGSDCIASNCPVGNVNWFEALEAANRLSAAHQPVLPSCYVLDGCTGTSGHGRVCTSVQATSASLYDCPGYRLPTEAEWEYAARGGTATPFYSGDIRVNPNRGDCFADPNLDTIAWYCFNAGQSTHPVGTKLANPYGLSDMIGNSMEWVSDLFTGLGYGGAPLTDPGSSLGWTGSAPARVTRGGFFNAWSPLCRAANRYEASPPGRGPGVGFRLVRTVPGP
ncbi:MAG: serine/threonine kinase [Myxococcaceae bacterium]|nr:serine/threonine kinase [Myxococcaceae bacterium]